MEESGLRNLDLSRRKCFASSRPSPKPFRMRMPEPTLPTSRQNLPPAVIDCKWWKQGYCFRGRTCYFRHDAALVGIDKPKDGASREKKEPRESETGGSTLDYSFHNTNEGSHDDVLQADSECKDDYSPSRSRSVNLDNAAVPSVSIQEQCAICFQIPSTLGLLVNCDHVFCLSMRT
jgi:E3 ubiquitin-protein ligase makorin